MENPPEFDLNRAIEAWRGQWAASPAFQGEDVNELETHLRDSIESLQARSLSAEEAFLVANKRLGTRESLECEFGKVNGERVWLGRAVWMLSGSLLLGPAASMVWAGAGLAAVGAHALIPSAHLAGALHAVLYIGGLAGLILTLWMLARRNGFRVRAAGRWIQAHPATAALGAALALLLVSAASHACAVVPARTMDMEAYARLLYWRMGCSTLTHAVLWPGLLAWLLIRLTGRGASPGRPQPPVHASRGGVA